MNSYELDSKYILLKTMASKLGLEPNEITLHKILTIIGYLRDIPKLSKYYTLRKAKEHVREMFREALGDKNIYKYSPLIFGLPTIVPEGMINEYSRVYGDVVVVPGGRDLTREYLRACKVRFGEQLTEQVLFLLNGIAMHCAYTLIEKKYLRKRLPLKWDERVGKEWVDLTRALIRVWMEEILLSIIEQSIHSIW